jgi:hypothetical protein
VPTSATHHVCLRRDTVIEALNLLEAVAGEF